MDDKFLAFIRDNQDEVRKVYEDYYSEKAVEEGCEMQGDDRFYGEDGYEHEPEEIYEDFAHAVGNSAAWAGASGVISTYANDFDEELDPDDEDLQEMVLDLLEQNVY